MPAPKYLNIIHTADGLRVHTVTLYRMLRKGDEVPGRDGETLRIARGRWLRFEDGVHVCNALLAE